MEIRISTRNLTVTSRFHDYVRERVHKIEHLTHHPDEFQVKVSRRDHSKTSGAEDEVELSVHDGHKFVRANAHATDKFAAFDLALAKLTEQLRRIADRRKVHHGKHSSQSAAQLAASDFASLDLQPVDAEVLENLRRTA